jgi:hypothetical protein
MSRASELMYAVAKAINGPHYEEPGQDLNHERDIEWAALSVQDKRRALQRARMAIEQYKSGSTVAIGLRRPI